MTSAPIYFTYYPSPIGKLRLRTTDSGLIAVDHTNQQAEALHAINNPNHPHIQQATAELNEYFQKQRTSFNVPLSPQGTAFQLQVWQALSTIPYGETKSYSDIATTINRPKAVRAVGLANGKNPLSIFIPCHRVIGKNQTLTGYAGGLKNKQYLLQLEQNQAELFTS